MKRRPLTLSQLDCHILKNNSMIMITCGSFLRNVKMEGNEGKLLITKYQLKELLGFVAAEANHATSEKKEQEFNRLFGYLESALNSLFQ